MELLPGVECPSVSLPTSDGGRAQVPERGRAQVVFFFKVECPTSPLAVPALKRLRNLFPAEKGGPALLGVSQDEPLGTRTWCERHGVHFPVAIDADGFPASTAFGLVTVPSLALIDGAGRVVAVQEGWSRQGYDDFARAVADTTGLPYNPIAPEGGPAFRPG